MRFFLFFIFIFLINFSLIFSQEIFDSSNIFLYKTPPLSSNYSLRCNLVELEKIKIFWQGKAFAKHRLILSYLNLNNQTSGTLLTTTYILPDVATSGNYLHLNIPNSKIKYNLKIDYEDQNFPDENLETICETGVFLIAPSNLEVYPISQNQLHITWKDNITTTDQYGYLLERIKLTPDKPFDISVNYFDNEIKINWKNNTISNKENGPFYHIISICKGNSCGDIEKNFSIITSTFSITTSTKEFDKIKIKACSTIKLDINFDKNPDLICSEEEFFISQISQNNKFQFLSNVLNIFNKFLNDFKNIFKKEVKGQENIDINRYFNNSDIKIKLINPPFGVYQDNRLLANTVYYYKLRACKIENEPPFVINEFNLNNCSAESYGGAKTTSGLLNKKIKLCAQNSMCKEFNGFYGRTGELINQCNVNYDCVNVGKSQRTYQER